MPQAHINNHEMYYEIHGSGEPVLCSGGWGTFCHGARRHLPAGLTERYRVVIFDHRGLGSSSDDASVPATTGLYAEDVIGLAAHLKIEHAHLVGIGACIFQEVALRKPELVRSLVNTGCWARPDDFFLVQMRTWLEVHEKIGFEAFQRLVVMEAFPAEFFIEKRDRLLGPQGGWKDLNGHIGLHRRLTEAASTHDTLDRLGEITAPTLVVHNAMDFLTGPRLTLPVEQGIPGAQGHTFANASHVITDRKERAEFAQLLLGFLAEH